MRTRIMYTAAAAAAAIAAAGVAQATATSPSTKDKPRVVKTIRLFATTIQAQNIDVGPANISLGDEAIFTDDLARTRGGQIIGNGGAVCVTVRINASTGALTDQCTITARLPRGQITGQGLVTFLPTQPLPTLVLPVTGGSGEYQGAAGELTVTDVTPTSNTQTFRLINTHRR